MTTAIAVAPAASADQVAQTVSFDKGAFNLGFQIAKVDAERREVWGYATAEVPDAHGDIMDYEGSKTAFAKWPGNIREQHDLTKAVGTAIAVQPEDATKRIWLGVKITSTPDGDVCLQKVKDKIYKGFSIKGNASAASLSREIVKDAAGQERTYQRIRDYDLEEVSIVDNPACPVATISLVKALQKNSVHDPQVSIVMPLLDAAGPAAPTKTEDAPAAAPAAAPGSPQAPVAVEKAAEKPAPIQLTLEEQITAAVREGVQGAVAIVKAEDKDAGEGDDKKDDEGKDKDDGEGDDDEDDKDGDKDKDKPFKKSDTVRLVKALLPALQTALRREVASQLAAAVALLPKPDAPAIDQVAIAKAVGAAVGVALQDIKQAVGTPDGTVAIEKRLEEDRVEVRKALADLGALNERLAVLEAQPAAVNPPVARPPVAVQKNLAGGDAPTNGEGTEGAPRDTAALVAEALKTERNPFVRERLGQAAAFSDIKGMFAPTGSPA